MIAVRLKPGARNRRPSDYFFNGLLEAERHAAGGAKYVGAPLVGDQAQIAERTADAHVPAQPRRDAAAELQGEVGTRVAFVERDGCAGTGDRGREVYRTSHAADQELRVRGYGAPARTDANAGQKIVHLEIGG